MPNSMRKSRKKGQGSASNKKASLNKPQSSVTKGKLIDFLIKSAQQERKLQLIKQMLAEQEQFTPASLFHRIDSARKGFIVEKDIQDFLIDNKASFKGSQLKLLFGKINANQSPNGVNLREFQNFILPNQNPRLRYFTMRRPIYIPLPHQKLSQKIEWISLKLFSQIIKQSVKLMQYNSALISSFDFNAAKTMQLLGDDKYFITGQSVNRFMVENSVEISVQQIGCLINLMDRKGQGRVHQDDFNHYLATLGLKRQHEIFDQLSPIPALKNAQKQDLTPTKDRQSTLYQRYLDNKSYNKNYEVNELGGSRRSGLSRSRKNY